MLHGYSIPNDSNGDLYGIKLAPKEHMGYRGSNLGGAMICVPYKVKTHLLTFKLTN